MQRKNILLVSFDDAVAPWPYKTVFQEPLQTPNLDRLCEVSTAFHAAYSQAPICGPSRSSMMTTMMPHEIGVVDNSTELFQYLAPQMVWSHELRKGEYFCSSGGKVHHRYKPLRPDKHAVLYDDQRKFFADDMALPKEIRQRSKNYGGLRNGRGTKDGIDDHTYYDAQVATSAINFLENYDDARPFYREVGFFSPHVPHFTPARFKELYNSSNLKKPEDWSGYVPDNAYAAKIYPEREEVKSNEWWQHSIRNYFSAFSHGDYHLGRVLDALKNSRHAQNTVVVVVSDHGFHLGSRNLFRKSTLWEQSLRVPFIIFDPDQPTARQVHDPVGVIDLGPTILDFAGVDPPKRKPGRSLRPFLDGAKDPNRTIPSFFRNNAAIRRGNYRIIRYADGSHQLFDVEADFWQLHDLGQQHPMFEPMAKELAQCSAACGLDFSSLSDPEPEESVEDSNADDPKIQAEPT